MDQLVIHSFLSGSACRARIIRLGVKELANCDYSVMAPDPLSQAAFNFNAGFANQIVRWVQTPGPVRFPEHTMITA